MIAWAAGVGRVLEGELADLLAQPGETKWIDIRQPAEADLNLLTDAYGLQRVDWEQAMRTALVPKAQSYPQYVFIIWFMLEKFDPATSIASAPFSLFRGEGFLITAHRAELTLLNHVWEAFADNPAQLADGSFRPFYRLMSEATYSGLPVLEDLDAEIDSIEDDFLNLPGENQLTRLSLAKHNLLGIKKIFFFESATIYMLSSDSTVFDAEERRYLEDLHQTLLYLVDMADTYRDVITGAIDLHLSAISNRLNEVMKRLTVIATIFMPLTFIAGVYGMNFHNMPELAWRWGYLTVWLVMLVIGVSMVIYFRRKKWF